MPPRSDSPFWQRNTRKAGTHIETLADGTPKSRRRVRRILDLNLKPTDTLWPLDVLNAQKFARAREQSGAMRDAAKRSAGGVR